MSKVVNKKNIPESGDLVDIVKYNKSRTIGCIFFDSGKKVFFQIDPGEFGKSMKQKSKKSIRSESVNSMDKNSPNDENYQNQVLQTLSRMDGIPIEQLQTKMKSTKNANDEFISNKMEKFEIQKKAALRSSEERSRILVEDLSRSSGGKIMEDGNS